MYAISIFRLHLEMFCLVSTASGQIAANEGSSQGLLSFLLPSRHPWLTGFTSKIFRSVTQEMIIVITTGTKKCFI